MRVRGGHAVTDFCHANTVDKFEKPKSTAKRIQAQDTRDCGHMFCSKEHAQWATSSFSNRFAKAKKVRFVNK